MSDVICDKCKKIMRKKSTLMMSNTKVEVYICSNCGEEKKKAVAVMT